MRRPGILVTAVVAVATAAVASCESAQRDDEGNVVEGGDVGAQDVQVGDCYNDTDEATETETIEVFSVAAVPCDEAHDNEVYALFDLPDGEFPGEDAVVELSSEGCLERFAEFLGVEYEQTSLDISLLFPLAESWEDGDRGVVCAIVDPAGPVTGTLEGQGEQYRFAVQGDCMDEAGLAVDCGAEHYAEIYLDFELDGEEFPGVDAVDSEAVSLCEQSYAEFVGTDWGSSSLDFLYWVPEEAGWAEGVRTVTCAVYDPEGPLTGSVQGSGL